MTIIRFLVCVLILWSPAAHAAVESIDGIAVDAQADSAVAAKEKAFAEARLTALRKWMATHGENPSQATASTAERATVFIDVMEEKSAGKRYKGILRVGLDTALLVPAADQSATLVSAPVSSGWVLLIPVHRNAHGPTVWNSADPWQAEWMRPVRRGPTDFVVTGGDEDDKQQLSDWAAATADANALQHLTDKYKSQGTALVTLDTVFSDNPNQEGIVEVALWTPARGVMVMRAPVKGSSLTVQGRVIALSLLEQLTENGQAFTAPASTPILAADSPAVIEVPLNATLHSPQRWMEIRYALARIPGLVVKPIIVTPTRAEMLVRYPGTRERLIQELGQWGLLR